MTPEQRNGVLANAKYLRHVRPLDPAELCEYVEGSPHPAAVRRVLREAAATLEIIEREDGRFVPVPDTPIEPRAASIETVPTVHARRLEDYLTACYGPTWWQGSTGDQLRSVIRQVKEQYYRGHPVEYDEDVAAGYAIYHLPTYYATIQYVLDDIAERHLLSRHLRVLDVGAGVGGPALGLFDYLPDDALCEYHAVEPSAAVEILDEMLEGVGRNVYTWVHRMTAESFQPEGPYDLLFFANVLSELADPLSVVRRYADHLAPDGSLLLLAPADRETSTGLRQIERDLTDGLTVYSPTTRLWPGFNPTDHGWSFDVRPDLTVPTFQRRLDAAGDGSGEFVNVDVQYSYAILRADGVRRIEFRPDPDRFARFADSEHHVTERIDCVAIKLSHDLAAAGNPLFKVGDGSEQVAHYAVMPKPTALNRELRDADYGDLLVFTSVLVLWNDDETAYNLIVDAESVVDRLSPRETDT